MVLFAHDFVQQLGSCLHHEVALEWGRTIQKGRLGSTSPIRWEPIECYG